MAQQPPGTVAVLYDSEMSRFARFASDLVALDLPEGSTIDFGTGENKDEVRNALVDRAIKRDSYWIWFIEESHTFGPTAVKDLLSREEALVVPIVLEAEPPFNVRAATTFSRTSKPVPLSLDPVVGPGSLIEIIWAPPTGMLIRRAVLDVAAEEWFGGEDDICAKARHHGIQPYLDTAVRLGNWIIASVEPVYRAGKWELSVSARDMEFVMPAK